MNLHITNLFDIKNLDITQYTKLCLTLTVKMKCD